MNQISQIFILIFVSWQKNPSSIEGLEVGLILFQLKLKIVNNQNLQDWLSESGK
jgi:hypothetical protein